MFSQNNSLYNLLKSYGNQFHQVVKFNYETDRLALLDFTKNNVELAGINMQDIEEFRKYISDKLEKEKVKFGFGGYNELRVLYNRSGLFDKNLPGNKDENAVDEPRRLHIGIDIWGVEGTEVYAPADGVVHSFGFNNNFGDYGATIILKHRLEETFFTLYGHVSLPDIENIKAGKAINCGEKFASFGKPEENGHWPPHLHFQIIIDIGEYKGDYPGVCKFSEREKYLQNSPDPDLILNMKKYLIKPMDK